MTFLVLATAHANLFGIKDHDGDGIPDKTDQCMHHKEVVNGFHDEDGCPDAMSAVEIAVWIDGNPARNAPFRVVIDGKMRRYTGSMVARDLQPGTPVRAYAQVGCLDGEASFQLADTPKRVRLNLVPRQKEVQVRVQGPSGGPGRARIHWDGLRACGPTGPMRIHGERTLSLGVGEHTVGLGRAGRKPFTFVVTTETEFVVIPASVDARVEDSTDALDPVVYFASGKAALDATAHAQVQAAYDWLVTNPSQKMRIEGHADERASETYNQDLSQRRAAAVQQALLALGASEDRLVITAEGEGQPAAAGWTESALSQNRRVNFYGIAL